MEKCNKKYQLKLINDANYYEYAKDDFFDAELDDVVNNMKMICLIYHMKIFVK